MSSTKPEVQKYRNAARAELGHGHRQDGQKLAKFDYVVFDICERTDRQTDILITMLRTFPVVGAK